MPTLIRKIFNHTLRTGQRKKKKTAANKESKQLESSKPILIDVPDSNGKFDDGIDYSAI